MQKFLNGLGIFLVVLVLGIIFSSVKGIFWPDKEIIEVTSMKDEGIKLIEKYNIKFIPDRVIGTLWTDFYISKAGKYAFDFKEDSLKEKYSYKIMDNKFVDQYEFRPKYNWWQSNGVFALIGIGLFLSLFGQGLFKVIFAILDEV